MIWRFLNCFYKKDDTVKKVFWSKSMIAIVADAISVHEHKHQMLHLFYTHRRRTHLSVNDQRVIGNCVVVDSNIPHAFYGTDVRIFIACIDSTTVLAERLHDLFIKENGYGIIDLSGNDDLFDPFLETPDNTSFTLFCKQLSGFLGIENFEVKGMDDRIRTLLDEINRFSHLKSTTGDLSKSLFLSESRLSHLFKEETGIPLKSYLVLIRVKKAYELLYRGKSITEAAVESGFYSASHLADTCRKLTGLPMSEMIKDSSFLEA